MLIKILLAIAVVLVILTGIGWLGLRIKPKPFTPYPGQTPELQTVPLPEGLPTPVARYYRQLYGDEIPVITSAVVSGRGQLAPFGFSLPARFRFTHEAGQGYRHYIEATWFGIPIMKVNEWYLDGHGRLELPIGTVEGPKTNQGANLGLWAESVNLPAIWLTDERVPFGAEEQQFVVRFDPANGRVPCWPLYRFGLAALFFKAN